jgi:two-component system cell cycle response regulator
MAGSDDSDWADDDGARTIIARVSERVRPGAVRDRHLLVQLEGEQIGQLFVLHGAQWRVGRHQDSELCLRDSSVSRRHARFVWQAGGYFLQDLGSANGSHVGGSHVTQHRMQDGDIVQFGSDVMFRYLVADAQEEAMLQQLYDASVTDALTGAYKREHFDSRLAAELSFARRHQSALSLLLLDLDHFKHVNDTYGHQAGDVVLQELTRAVKPDLRVEDVLARYGGEEFAIILRGINLEGAQVAAERYRRKVEGLLIVCGGHTIPVTASIGCASLSCCPEWTSAQLIATADRRLYTAKRAGRNQVVATG